METRRSFSSHGNNPVRGWSDLNKVPAVKGFWILDLFSKVEETDFVNAFGVWGEELRKFTFLFAYFWTEPLKECNCHLLKWRKLG